jgi:hypothetical protein
MHVHDECLDERGRYVLPEVYQPIARLHADNYIVADRQFVLKKPAELLRFEEAAGDTALPGSSQTRLQRQTEDAKDIA